MAGHFTYKEGDVLGLHNMKLLKRTTRTKRGRWKGVFQCTYSDCVYWDICNKLYEVEISLVVSGRRYKCGRGNRKTPLTKKELGLEPEPPKKIKDKPKRNKFKHNSGDRVGPYGVVLLERLYKRNDRWYASFQCPYCGNSFIASIHDVNAGHSRSCGCLANSTKEWSNGKTKWNDGDYIGPYNVKLIHRLDEKDKNGKPLGLFECPYCDINDNCKKTFVVPIERVSNGITSSCGCKKISHGEEKIINILTNADIQYYTQYTFDDCINPDTGRKLRFDFYLPEYNFCIEYDGQQHFLKYVKKYESGWNSFDAYSQGHKRDLIKNLYCQEHNIGLFRIPYYDYNKIDINYIIDGMKDGK